MGDKHWRRIGRREYELRMGPVVIVADGDYYHPRWGWRARVVSGACALWIGIGSTRDGLRTLRECKKDAIAAVERWRDSIQAGGRRG